MKLTDEQIASIMTKDVICKSILISKTDVEKTISNYLNDGWELVNKITSNDFYKLTFRKVK